MTNAPPLSPQSDLVDTARRLAAAVQAAPADHRAAGLWNDLGVALAGLHDGRAGGAFERAFALDPNLSAAGCNAAIWRFQAGDVTGAETLAARACAAAPGAPEPKQILAAIKIARAASLRAAGLTAQAAAALQAALDLGDDAPESWIELGACRLELGDLAGAEASFRAALARRPDDWAALVNLGVALIRSHRPAEALTPLERAALLAPDQAGAALNYGVALLELGRFADAADAFARAAALEPTNADAHANLGAALSEQALFPDATQAYRRAVALRPGDVGVQAALLFALGYDPGAAPQDLTACARTLVAAEPAPPLCPGVARPGGGGPNIVRRLGTKLRVGWLGGDFRRHSAMRILGPLLERVDPSAVEIAVYAEIAAPDDQTERTRRAAARYRSTLGLSDGAVADAIRDDGVDLLIDLGGRTRGARPGVVRRRPAPVIAAWMGAGATTGLREIDWVLSDRLIFPPGSDDLLCEGGLWRLDRPVYAWEPPDVDADPGALADGAAVTFGCCSRLIRINDQVAAVWAQILAAVPGSRLWLNARGVEDPAVAARLRARFAAAGLEDPAQLILRRTQGDAALWDAYRRIDVALDPFPHAAGTTTIDALWMGVPVITLAGPPPLGRFGAALLTPLGRQEWVAETAAGYIDRAIALATGPRPDRAALRAQLGASPLFDVDEFARAMTAAWRGMVDRAV